MIDQTTAIVITNHLHSHDVTLKDTLRIDLVNTPTPHHSIFSGRMLFLTPNQQRQSTYLLTFYWTDCPQNSTANPNQ